MGGPPRVWDHMDPSGLAHTDGGGGRPLRSGPPASAGPFGRPRAKDVSGEPSRLAPIPLPIHDQIPHARAPLGLPQRLRSAGRIGDAGTGTES